MRIGVGLRPMSSTTQVTSQAKCEPSVPKGEGVDAVIHLAGNGWSSPTSSCWVVVSPQPSDWDPTSSATGDSTNRGLDANAIMHVPANDLLDDLDTRVARATSRSPCRARTGSRMCRMP